MLDLSPLKKTLTTPGTPGVDTLDPRFQDIAAAAEAAEYVKAGTLTAALFQEDLYDIRLLGYYLYAVAEEGGLPVLGEVFSTLSGLLRDSWAAIGPATLACSGTPARWDSPARPAPHAGRPGKWPRSSIAGRPASAIFGKRDETSGRGALGTRHNMSPSTRAGKANSSATRPRERKPARLAACR